MIQPGSRPTRAIIARTFSRMLSRESPGSSAFSGSAMDWPTGMRGSRLASGSWNTIWKSFAQGAQVRLGRVIQIAAQPHHASRRRGRELEHRPRQGGLAAAGFSHHAQRLALVQGEAHAIHRAQD